MALKEAKEVDCNDKLADQARQALDWEQEKFERETKRAHHTHELKFEENKLARKLDGDQALLLAQNHTASYERRERREVIKECQKTQMSISEIKEYLGLMFLETEYVCQSFFERSFRILL